MTSASNGLQPQRIGIQEDNTSSRFYFSSKKLSSFFHIYTQHFPSWKLLITSISTHSSSVLFCKQLFWFHTCTIIINIFSPYFWLYRSFVKLIATMNEMPPGIFVILKDITDVCPLKREPLCNHLSNGTIIILPCDFFMMWAILLKTVSFPPS